MLLGVTQKLLLFDIDGTLLRTHGAGVRAMMRAALEILGERCRGARINVGGALDPWIFGELARHGGYTVHDHLHTSFRAAYARYLPEEIVAGDKRAEATPGVLELLAKLRADKPARLGMLTGNYAETGSVKLRHVGIDPDWFSPAIWGDAAEDRPGLVRVALERVGVAPRDTIVIGDTPRDVHCAHHNGARCLGVATGFHGVDALRAAGADRVVEDLRDPRVLYEMIAD
jgi:phosphoglycolate phosphatase-like HAD superfamily hydrolase